MNIEESRKRIQIYNFIFAFQIKVTSSPEFPYAKQLNEIDSDICTFARMPTYINLMEASGHTLPQSCPIKPGVYHINNFRVSLEKYPLLWRGFDIAATFILHKNDRVLSKMDLQGSYR